MHVVVQGMMEVVQEEQYNGKLGMTMVIIAQTQETHEHEDIQSQNGYD